MLHTYVFFVDMARLAPTLEPIGRGAVLGRAVCEWKWPVAAKKLRFLGGWFVRVLDETYGEDILFVS